MERSIHTSNSYGNLTIFFSYALGVGKSEAMIKAAQSLKQNGSDVVIGFRLGKEHGNFETIKVNQFNELDVDAILLRHPQLVLVDDFAHVNHEGSRHAKRYQDIEELRNHGIHVYTTMNVQNLESLHDIVESIIPIDEKERIPDRIFDQATHVEFVDMDPYELFAKLRQSSQTLYHEEQLVALRSLAYHRFQQVEQVVGTAQKEQKAAMFHEEHILVCLSPSPSNAKIIRAAARMAHAYNGDLTALFVETSENPKMKEEDRRRLRYHMHIAQQFGATIETAYGDDVAFQIAEYARLSNISRIVIGRSNAHRRFRFGKTPLMEQLLLYAPQLDICVIYDEKQERYQFQGFQDNEPFVLQDVIKSVITLAVATLIGYTFDHLGFSEANIITVYILGVLITAIITSKRMYSLISSIVSVLVFNFFFTVPRYTLNAYDAGYPATFLIMFFAAFITSSLAVKIKQHAKQAARTAYRTKVLLDTNQLLQQAQTKNQILSITAQQLMKLLDKDILFYPNAKGELGEALIYQRNHEIKLDSCFQAKEHEAATWVLKNNQRAGAGTHTCADVSCQYLAVRLNQNVYGVFGLVLQEEPLEAFENDIVLSILGECALALENEQVAKEKEEAAILAKNEQLRANLLRSISHDLRTPLTSISGNAGVLLSGDESLPLEKRMMLYQNIYDDSLWLINLVENLLSVTRIEDGTMQLKLSAELLDEVIGEALQHVSNQASKHHIVVHQNDDYLLAKMDVRLIVQVIINIIDNALKYTKEGSTITISSHQEDDMVVVEIADDGDGINDDIKPHIFDMFYTASKKVADSRRSLGLGLALCKTIINAHGGEIWIRDHQPHGALFVFTLPAKEVQLHE